MSRDGGRRRPAVAVGIVALAAVLGAGCAAVPAAPLPPWLQSTAVAGAPSEAGSATSQPPTPQQRAQRCDIAGGDTALVNPAVVGLDVEQVQRAVGVAAQSGASSLRVYRHDCLVAKSLADTVTERMRLPLWSLTKGLVALVAGRAVTLGFAHLDDSIGKYLPNVDELHSRITIRHLLTQTSGLRFAWANDVMAGGVGNSVDYALALPFDHEPGSYFEYAQVTVSLLAAVVASAVGQPFAEFAQRNLFDPLGIADAEVAWATDAAGNTLGYAFAEATPVALGKIGSLLLRNGVFDGRQLISERFVQEARSSSPANPKYGFLMWTNQGSWGFTGSELTRRRSTQRWMQGAPQDAFGLTGMLEQYVIVIPSTDMVIVRTGFFGPNGWKYDLMSALGRAVQDQDVPTPAPYVEEPIFEVTLESLGKAIDLDTWQLASSP